MRKANLTLGILCAILAVLLTGCGGAASSAASAPASGAGEAIDGGAGMANPLEELADWNALHDALGFPMAAPNFAQEVKYFVLDKDIAQITFSTLRGVDYTLRGTTRTENVSGVRGHASAQPDITVIAADRTTSMTQTFYTTSTAVYRWAWDGVNYTLVCQGANGQNIDLMVGMNTHIIASKCADISAQPGSARDAKAYLEQMHQTVGALQGVKSYKMKSYEQVDKSMLAPDTPLNSNGNITLSTFPVDNPNQSALDDPANVTWFQILKSEDAALLVRVEMELERFDGTKYPIVIYDLLQQAENGNYYLEDKISENKALY